MRFDSFCRAALAVLITSCVGCADRGDDQEQDRRGAVSRDETYVPGETDRSGSTVTGTGIVIGNGSINGNRGPNGLVTTIGGANSSEQAGNGDVRETARNASAVSHVVNESGLFVQVRQGEPAIGVHLDSNLESFVETSIADDTLTIRLSHSISTQATGPYVLVSVPRLRSAVAAAAGKLDVAAHDPSGPITLRASAAGPVSFSGEAAELTATSEAAGEIELSGTAQRVTLTSRATGGIDAEALTADSGSIDLSGVGSVTAHISGVVDVRSSGLGSVTISGGATARQVSNEGRGKVTIR